MCARFTQHHTPAQVTERFQLKQLLLPVTPRYNIAPSQTVTVVLNEPNRVLTGCRWGLIPAWAQDPAIGSRMINARAETLTVKPAFRRLLKNRRCLIPADGFFEWTGPARQRQPIYFCRRDRALFAFAGLWDEWQDPQTGVVRSFTIITTVANAVVRPVHDRMPVILSAANEDAWLASNNLNNSQDLDRVLTPYPADAMDAFPVTTKMNSPAWEDPAGIQPETTEPQLL